METIYIYNGASRWQVPITDNCERAHSLQQHNYVKLSWKSAENTPISANAYIEYEGQVFYCIEEYYPTHKDGIYEYDIEFHAIEDTFNRPLFFRYVDILDQTTGETTSWKEIEWSINSNLRTIAEIVVDSLNRAYDNAYFALPNDSYADTLLLSYSFASNSIADALSTIAEQNETEWWLETTTEYSNGKHKYILHFDKCELGDTIELNDNYTEDANGVWQSGGLKSVSQSGNINTIPQKLYVYGSERNIIKKTVEQEVAGGAMNVSYDKKLRLPKRLANNTNLYYLESVGILLTLNEDSSITIGGINNKFEQVKIFDEVYPKMNMTVKGVSVQNPNSENPIYWLKGDRLKSITTENPADDSINPGKLGLLIEGCTLMCTFTSGLLNGREFECSWRESTAEIGLIPIDENDVQIPSGVFKPQEGDTFILWNLAMPQSSIDIAQKELLTEAINYIEELVTSITETDCTTEAEATRISGLNTKIKVGQRISVNSNVFRNGRLSSRIIKFSYKLTKPYDISFTLASSRQTGRLATLQNLIADVTHEVHSVGQVQRAISRRQWHDTEEMMSMLDSIQKQMVVVGDENNSFTTTCNVAYNDTNKELFISKGYLQHQSYTDNEWKGAWLIEQDKTISMPALDEKGVTPFYVYFVCSKNNNTGYAEIGSALPQFNDNYVFVLGILSSEFEGERIFNQSSGLTSIAGGTITTDVVQDPGRRLIIDYSNATIIARNGATIKGAIQFEKGEGENDLGTALDDLLNGLGDVEDKFDNLEVGGRNILRNSKEYQFALASSSNNYNYITYIPTVPLSPNTDYVFSVEKSELLVGTATQFSVIVITKEYGVQRNAVKVNISNKKQFVKFTTPSSTLSTDVVLIYNGVAGSTAGNQLKLTKVKLEQGNIATDWSPAPEDVEQAIVDAEDRMGENLADAVETINGGIDALQKQVDGEVNSWFMQGEPTLNNAPVIDWIVKNEDGTTNEDETKKEYQRHEGDTYTDISEITLLGSWLWEQGGIVWGSGANNDSVTTRIRTNFIPIQEGVVYVPNGYEMAIYYYGTNYQFISANSYSKSFNIVNTEGHYYFKLSFIKRPTGTEEQIYPPIADELKLSINPTSGQSWRWCNCTYTDESGTTISGWHWHKIADSDAVKALAEAGKAQATADGKSTTFIVQPSNYSKGDLWILASDTNVNGTSYKSGTILTANEASATYVASHWGEKVKYTDDVLAKKAEQDAATAQQKADKAQTDATNAQTRMTNWANDSNFSKLEQQGLEDEKRRIEADKSDIDKECEKYILTSDTTYTEYVTAYNTIIGQLNSVVTSLDTNDYIAIPTNFATNHQTYYDKRTLVLERISDRADEVANEYADKKVGEIEVGGRNGFLKSKLQNDLGNLTATNATLSNVIENGVSFTRLIASKDASSPRFNTQTSLIKDIFGNSKPMVLSMMCRGSISGSYFLQWNYYENGTQKFKTIYLPVSTEWKKQHVIIDLDTMFFKDNNWSTFIIPQNSTFDFYNIKLEKGSIATDWTPAQEDIDAEIADTMNAIETLNDDSIFQQSEKLTIRKEWEEISGTAVTPSDTADVSTTYGDNGSYQKTIALIPSGSGISTDNIASKIEALRAYLSTYKLYRNNKKFLRVGETDPAVVSGFSRSTLAQHFQAYYNEEANIVKAINDHFAQKQVKDLQIGGVNLAIYKDVKTVSNLNKIGNFGFKQITADTKTNFELKIDNFYSSSSYDRWSNNAIISEVGRYSYYIKTTYSTSQIRVGTNGSQRDSMAVFPLKEVIPSGTNIVVSVEITNITQGSYEFKNIQIEKGNKATEWKPNDADKIEARDNILKNAMMVTLNEFACTPITLTNDIKANTEYVFSIENVILRDNDSSAKVEIYATSNGKEDGLDPLYTFDVTPDTKFAQVVIFSQAMTTLYLATDYLTAQFIGVKLAEGNVYTGWQGTQEEQQSLMALSTAMKGTTDIIGGLMLTNMIGMKDSAGVIKSGISGLSENDNLRFWAGSNGWGTEQNAPFRVYDDGRVFGTHFYGFHSALPIMSTSALSSYSKGSFTSGSYNIYIIDIRKTGSKILLGNLGDTIAITLPTPDYQNTSASLTSDLEYIGSEIEIYNPFGLKLHICGCDMPDPEYCDLYNMTTTYGQAKPSTHNGYPASNPIRWTMNRSTCTISNGITYKYAKFKCIRHNISYNDYTTNIMGYTKFSNNGYYVILWVLVECIK